ncbi:MAG: hypothetical protein LJF06_15070 [Gemmatimonadetes bacterium]|nr:hypothetical protein [Gemmatimonadota bacterium]
MIPIVPDAIRRARANVDRRTAWREVATLLGGELVQGKRPSGDKVGVARGPWKIWLDTFTVHTGHASQTYTRCRAYFVGWHELKVTVRRRNVFNRILEALGRSRPRAVSPPLLKTHVVRGKPASRLPSLFMAAGLVDALLSTAKVTLRVKRPSGRLRKRYGQDLGVVTCQATGVVRDVNRLAGMIHIVGETLEALAGIGEARKEEVAHGP